TVSFDLDQQADPTLYVDQLERFVEVARGRAVAIGNVDATKFEKTTKDAMVADVRRCVDTAARQSAFILSTSCEIPPKSDPVPPRCDGSWPPLTNMAVTTGSSRRPRRPSGRRRRAPSRRTRR